MYTYLKITDTITIPVEAVRVIDRLEQNDYLPIRVEAMFKFVVIPWTFCLLGVGLFLAIVQLHQQQSAPAAATTPLAPADAQQAPDLSSKYRGCVFETINVQQDPAQAAREEFRRATRGLSYNQLAIVGPLIPRPSAGDIEKSRQANFMRIKELCRLKFPCVDGEMVSNDYNTCLKR
jgi:hypothetical protein